MGLEMPNELWFPFVSNAGFVETSLERSPQAIEQRMKCGCPSAGAVRWFVELLTIKEKRGDEHGASLSDHQLGRVVACGWLARRPASFGVVNTTAIKPRQRAASFTGVRKSRELNASSLGLLHQRPDRSRQSTGLCSVK